MAINPILSRSQLDADLQVCDAQAIPQDGAADLSASSVDTGLTTPKIGVGARMSFKIIVTTAFVGASGVLTIKPIASASSNLGSAHDLSLGMEIPVASGTLGAVFDLPIPQNPSAAKLRYLGISMVDDATNHFSAGAIDVYLATD